LVRIFEHEAIVFIGDDIKFGVSNVGIDASHVLFLFFLLLFYLYCSAVLLFCKMHVTQSKIQFYFISK
jgi:hypothetical protein